MTTPAAGLEPVDATTHSAISARAWEQTSPDESSLADDTSDESLHNFRLLVAALKSVSGNPETATLGDLAHTLGRLRRELSANP